MHDLYECHELIACDGRAQGVENPRSWERVETSLYEQGTDAVERDGILTLYFSAFEDVVRLLAHTSY